MKAEISDRNIKKGILRLGDGTQHQISMDSWYWDVLKWLHTEREIDISDGIWQCVKAQPKEPIQTCVEQYVEAWYEMISSQDE